MTGKLTWLLMLMSMLFKRVALELLRLMVRRRRRALLAMQTVVRL